MGDASRAGTAMLPRLRWNLVAPGLKSEAQRLRRQVPEDSHTVIVDLLTARHAVLRQTGIAARLSEPIQYSLYPEGVCNEAG